jgi:hypothetical protein
VISFLLFLMIFLVLLFLSTKEFQFVLKNFLQFPNILLPFTFSLLKKLITRNFLIPLLKFWSKPPLMMFLE